MRAEAQRSIKRVKVQLAQTHRNLYYAYTAYAVLDVLLGLNFLFLHPTFNPLDIPKLPMGIIFLSLGVATLTVLNLWRSIDTLRVLVATNLTVMFFWAGALIVAYFELHQTSLQLPIVYLGLGILGLPLLAEPYINPATDRNGINGKAGKR